MAERRPRLLLAAAMLTWTVLMKLDVVDAIWLTLPSSGTTKCVSEDIQNNVVVVADYHVVVDDGNAAVPIPTVSARVTSPYGNNLHHIENVTSGQFAFTTKEAGVYLACFWLDAHHGEDAHHREDAGLSLSLDWKIGIAAKDWDTVAKKDKIEGVQLELVKLEGIVQAIHENLNYLKDREAEMREVSEQTNARVAWFSIMSLGTCIVVSVIQLWRLQHYFQKKKLI